MRVVLSIIGAFAIEDGKIMDRIMFRDISDYDNGAKDFLSKYQGAIIENMLPKFPEFFSLLHEFDLGLAKKKIMESVKQDNLVIQCINSLDDIDKATNQLAKRLREWYSLYFPEIEEQISEHKAFAEKILSENKTDMMKKMGISQSMGSGIVDLEPIMQMAKEVKASFWLRDEMSKYLEQTAGKLMPNITALCGASLAAKLLARAGTLKRLALLPSSTVQLLGAEKALFRHIRQKSKAPKHGIIIMHPLIAKAKGTEHGKIARALASKISIAAKLDYFHSSEMKGQDMLKELEQRFSK